MSTVATGKSDAPHRDEGSERAQAQRFARDHGVRLLLVLVLAVAAATGVGLLVVHVLDTTALGRFDLRVEHWLVDHRTARMDRLTGWMTLPAESITVAVLLVVVPVAAWFATRRWQAPVLVLLAVGGEKATYLATSLLVGRDRPPVPQIGHVYATGSFPSGHVGSAISLYGAVVLLLVWTGTVRAPVLKALLGVAVALLATAVAYARMYRGDHYPTDVVAGAIVGLTWLLLAWRVVLVRPDAHEPPGRSGSGASLRGARPAPGLSAP
jgi:undecaprenyl-diphosphatase